MNNLAVPKPQNYAVRHGRAAYVGLECERLIVSYHDWLPSPTHENVKFDIDAYDTIGVSYSIKTGTANELTNRLAFELDYEDAQGNVYPSWYFTGRADFYVFGYHNQLLYIQREKLHTFVDQHGWDCVLRPRAETLATNQRNHVAKNCRNGIISLHRLYTNNLVCHTEILDSDNACIKEYHRLRYGYTPRFLTSGKRFPTTNKE